MVDPLRKAFTPEAPRSSRSREILAMSPQTLFDSNTFTQAKTSSPSPSKPGRDETRSLSKEDSVFSMDTSLIDGQSQVSETISSSTSPKNPSEILDSTIEEIVEEKSFESEGGMEMSRKDDSVATLRMSPGSPKALLTIPEGEGKAPRGTTPPEDIDRNMSVAFRQELLSVVQIKIDSKVGIEVSRLSDPELNIIELFGRCLPDIVPNVLLAKREVIIMMSVLAPFYVSIIIVDLSFMVYEKFLGCCVSCSFRS